MAKYVTDTILTYTINQLCARIDANFTKRDEAIKSIELKMAVPTDKIGTSTTLEQCLRITYADNHEQLDANGDPIEHIIDLSLEALKTSGINFSAWEKTKDYKIGDYVVYDYKLYQAKIDHTSSTIDFDTDKNNWNLILGKDSSDLDLNDWEKDISYVTGNIVVYDEKLYKCLLNHTSTNKFEDDYKNGNWKLLIGNKYYEEDFTDITDFQVQHNLNRQFPDVKIIDADGNELMLDIEYFSNNLLILHSDVKVSGKVIVTKI